MVYSEGEVPHMDISIFEVIGPIMVGPSSSHTAGAARLARMARLIVAKPFTHVSFGLHGSFAKTYKGHGTDRALIAGVLGLRENDERLRKSFEIAAKSSFSYDFYEADLDHMHENSVLMAFTCADGEQREIAGSSIGGGQIVICKINGFDTELSLTSSTLIIFQKDQKGVVSEVTKVLADNDFNIGVMKVSRRSKGDIACCIIETDNDIALSTVDAIRGLQNIISAQAVNIFTREAGA